MPQLIWVEPGKSDMERLIKLIDIHVGYALILIRTTGM